MKSSKTKITKKKKIKISMKSSKTKIIKKKIINFNEIVKDNY
jgi:hypothetical protein